MPIESTPYNPSYLAVLIPTIIAIIVITIKTIQMVVNIVQDGVLDYVKDDWLDRLPYRLNTMPFRGVNRPAYTLICLVYYSIKSVLILLIYTLVRVYKFVLWDIWIWIFKTDKKAWFSALLSESVEDEEDDYEDEDEYIDEADSRPLDDAEELPFCQLFRVGTDMCLLVDHIAMCPDETAFIRVVDDEGYTPLYKRKVRRDKAGNRFIVFNGTNHYLDDNKTQPTSIKR